MKGAMVFDALHTESEYLQMSITSSAKVSNLCPTEGGEEAAESIERHTSPSSLATLKQGSESLFQKFNFFQQLIGLFTMTGIWEIFGLTTCYKVNLPPLQTFC